MKILQKIREVLDRVQGRVTQKGADCTQLSEPSPIIRGTTREEVVRLKALGWTQARIGKELGISFQTVSKHLKKQAAIEAKNAPPPPPFVKTLVKKRTSPPEPTPFQIDYSRVPKPAPPLPPPPPRPAPLPPAMPPMVPIEPEPVHGFRPIIPWLPPAEELLPIPIAPLPVVPSGIAGVTFTNVTEGTRTFFLIAHDPPSSLTGMNYTVDDWYHPAIVQAEYMNDPQQGLFTNAEKIIVIVEPDDIVFLTSIAQSRLAERCVVAQGIFRTGQECWQELSKPDDRGFHTRYSEPSGRTLLDFAKRFPPMPAVSDVEGIRRLVTRL